MLAAGIAPSGKQKQIGPRDPSAHELVNAWAQQPTWVNLI